MVNEAAMWWEGDTSTLASRYHGQYRPSQFSGGITGSVSRWFWGAPETQQNRRVHLPLPADIVATSATLLFDRAPVFTHPDQEVKGALDNILNPDAFPAELMVAGETCAALGAVGWRIMWDSDVSEHPWIEWVDADAVFPSFSYGRLASVMFVETLPPIDEKHVWRLFSEHTAGRITYRLMEGNEQSVGMVRPLPEHPNTVDLADWVDESSSQTTNIPVMAAGYIPNARPVVGFRRDGKLRHIGRPDLTPDLFPLFDSLDETWTEVRAEMRLSRKKIIVPDWMLKNRGLGMGASFDHDQEVFSPVKGHPDSNMTPEPYSPPLRIDAMLSAAEAWATQIIRRANYSPASFGMDSDGGAMTAREVDARYDASLKTWSAKSSYWRAGLKDAATALLMKDRDLHGKHPDVEPVRVEMARPVQETRNDVAQTVQSLDAARAVSTEQKVAMLWPEWDDERRDVETARILQEQAGTVDPALFAQADEPIDM
ncbi:phage portal protein [Corynebacterium timonense]|nr:phage portal protein [Corynebacterium timonense]